MNPIRLVKWYAFMAGGMDFLTGLGLVFFPAAILPLMHVEMPDQAALVFLRWVGAFVGAVGLLYWYALVAGGRGRMRVMLECTLVLRLAAGGFSLVAVVTGCLGPVWLSVPLTDLSLVILQAWILWKGDWKDD